MDFHSCEDGARNCVVLAVLINEILKRIVSLLRCVLLIHLRFSVTNRIKEKLYDPSKLEMNERLKN